MRTVLITGGSGFIGHHLCREMLANGWRVEVLTRNAARACKRIPSCAIARESLAQASEATAIVNLAGEDIAGSRWTKRQKQRLISSRLQVTVELLDAIAQWQRPPSVLVSGSAVGYYGARGAAMLDEDAAPGDEFQSELCLRWEEMAAVAANHGTRVCRIRTGLVLDAHEGALASMLTPFKLGLGGPLGDGRQYLCWIHIRDQVRAIRHLVETAACEGPFNLSAPEPVTNNEFTQTLARVLDRPRLGWVPAPLLRAAVGERARLMLTGQRVLPSALERSGFEFQHPDLHGALGDLVARS
jgi:hypothetical protein